MVLGYSGCRTHPLASRQRLAQLSSEPWCSPLCPKPSPLPPGLTEFIWGEQGEALGACGTRAQTVTLVLSGSVQISAK